MVRLTTLLLTLLLCLGSLSSSWATLKVSAARNQISINDTLVIQVQQQGDEDEEPDFSPLNKDFEVLGQSQSSQIQIINGDMSREKVWSLSMLPRRSGQLTIPPLCAGNDCSQPLTIEVLPQSEEAANDAEVILDVEATPLQAVVQGQILYTVRLFHRLPLTQGSLSSPEPQGVETQIQKLGEDRRFETYRNGWRYQVIERSYALFPQQSGKLRLPPLRFEGQLQSSERRRFDPFGQQGRVVRLRSDSIAIDVEPPTSNLHRWLPAQGLIIEDSWQQSPPTLTVGEPATRTLTIRAAGVSATQLPELNLSAPDSFKQYPDQATREDIVDAKGLSGVMVQKVALVPTKAGTFALPELSLSWWDIHGNSWRSEQVAAVTLQVLPAERQAQIAVPPAATPPATNAVAPSSKVAAAPTAPTPAGPPDPSATDAAGESQPAIALWQWLTAVCASGWLITTLLWLRTRRRQTPTSVPTPPTPPTVNIKVAKQQAISAAQANQASASRDALVQWGRQLWPHQTSVSLETWQQHSDDPLRQQLDDLSSHLYSNQRQPWQGQALAEALQNWQPSAAKDNNTTNELPSFYPPPR